MKIKTLMIACVSVATLIGAQAHAGEGRYQAYWNGKSYFVLDTDHGHMWNYYGDTLQYNGRIDGDDFNSPDKARIWQQSHCKWIEK